MTKTIYRNAKKVKFTPVSNSLLWDKEATLQAKGLLSIFLSNSNEWELNMKEIITRSKNGRDAHYTVVNELIELGYFARVQVVDPVKRQFEEMIYIFSDVKQEVVDDIENVKKWATENGKGLVIEYKTKKEKMIKGNKKEPFPENQDAGNQYINNTNSNNTKSIIDDDKRSSSLMNDEELNIIISYFREETKNELTERSFKSIVRKVVDKYKQGTVNSFRDYFVTALCNKMQELELRKFKVKQRADLDREQLKQLDLVLRRNRKLVEQGWSQYQKDKETGIEKVPFYNWLEE